MRRNIGAYGGKMKNEIIEEQRRAQREFLELKKMQNGEEQPEPIIHESDVMPKTAKEKIKNEWYHDKWFIIAGIGIMILITAAVIQCINKPKFDISIVLFTTSPVYESNADKAAEYLAKYCDDINGDGKTNIQVINCSYNAKSDNDNDRAARISKLQAVLASDADALLYVTDADGYEYLSQIANNSVFEGEPLKLPDDFYDYCNKDEYFTIPENLQISCRSTENALISANKKIDIYYEQAQKIMNGLSENK